MAFGFPAFHTEHFKPKDMPAAALKETIRAAITSLGWTIRDESADQIVAHVGINAFSWGERVTVTDQLDGSVSIASRCIFPSQCFDWGKNRSNVAALKKRLGA